MPSGSHGGGGGSHFGGSGGGHFGGFSGSGGSHYTFGGSHYSGPRRPGRAPIHFHFFYWGGRRYALAEDDNTKFRSFLFACFGILFAMIFVAIIIFASSGEMKKIKNDYDYYQDMIAYAEAHTEYLVEGKVEGKFYNEDYGKWYLTYTFLDENSREVEGYTFCIYTREEARDFVIGQTIELAVDSVPITQRTDSINMDYKDLPLERDGQYVSVKRTLILTIVIEIALAGALAFCAVMAIKTFKAKAEPANKDGSISPKLKYICTYCGAKLKEDDTTCPNCGSSTIETMKDE